MPGKISTFCLDIEEESKVNDNVEIGQDDQKDGNIEQNDDGSVNDVKGDDDKEGDDKDEGDKNDKNEDDKDEDDWFDAQEEIDKN